MNQHRTNSFHIHSSNCLSKSCRGVARRNVKNVCRFACVSVRIEWCAIDVFSCLPSVQIFASTGVHVSQHALLLTQKRQAACFALGNLVAAYPPAQMMVDEYHGIEALLKIIPYVRILRPSPPLPLSHMPDAERMSMKIQEIPASNFPSQKCREFLGLVPAQKLHAQHPKPSATQLERNFLSKHPKH